jgi:UDP-N-acetylglucosamine 2-epimerase (non-hydrolysing)
VLGVPCLTMRPNTERPIPCEIGTNVLVGTDPQRIVREADWILGGNARAGAIPEKCDGGAAERIVDVLLNQAVRDSSLRLHVSFRLPARLVQSAELQLIDS